MSTDIRLIALDIDGCLIGPDEELGFSALEVLRHATADTPIALCTGRSGAYTDRFLQMLGLSPVPSIVENGCFLYDSSKALISHPKLPKDLDLFENIRDLIRNELPEVFIELDKRVCISLHRPSGMPIEKLFEKTVLLLAGFSDQISITHSSAAVDITPKDINKRAGLEFLSRYTGIAPATILAIGDAKNDLFLLEYAGYAGCPGNSSKEVIDLVKQKSGYTAEAAYTEGVVEILRHFNIVS